MDTTASSALPLARQIGGARTSQLHRYVIGLPGQARPHPQRFALAALAALIHRYTGDTDLVLGVGSRSGAAEPIALRVPGQTSGADLLAMVTAAVPDAASAAGPARALDGQRSHAVVCAGSAQQPRALAALTVLTRQDRLELVMSAAEFDTDAAAQYARHLERILGVLAADPAVAVRDIALLTEEESRHILVGWNQTDEAVPAPYFHEVIAGLADRTPGAIAVAWPGGRLTFRELDEAANQLAHRLAATGIGRQDRIGVCFQRGPESLIAQLACFKLAAAAVLLDPDFPAERIRFMIKDACAAVVLTMTAHESAVAGICPVLALDATDWRAEPVTGVGERVQSDDLIHICYTSGSTGVPKAVMVRHGAARNLIYSMRVLSGMTSESAGTWLAAPGYGMVEVECFPVLAAGATVHIPEPSVVTSPEWLRDWFVAHRITHALLMKAMAERLWTLAWPADTALRSVRICGERVLSWPPEGLPFHVLNLYGSAEATVVAMCDLTLLARTLGAQGRARRLPPIGRPTPNVKAYVLGDDLRALPPGVIGEIYVAGESLSAGYLGQSEATAQKWIANPIDPARHPVLYRTGDLARCWIDGSIEIVGRTDNQVKVRGNRVHLGEIEAVLVAQPGVLQAAVLARTDDHGDVQLAAYIEPEPGTACVVRDIRRALQRKLPGFMVPTAYVVGGLPTTTNGKIDRAALPEPPRSRPDVDIPYLEPRNDMERSLQGLWAETLDVDGIGVLDNFFDLGGDSLRAARLTEQIRGVFDVDTEIDELFDEPSIERMASAIAASIRG